MAEPTKQTIPNYLLGTKEQQGWQKNYFFNPRGLSFFEAGALPPDHPAWSAFNIAKASYQIRPDVFNMDYLTKETGLKKEEIIKRMQRLYDERLIIYVMTPPMQIIGYGLYYWLVKLKDGTPKETKEKLSDWFQNNDVVCTGMETEGDFDCFNGTHMRVMDNLLHELIFPLKSLPEVEYVHLTPIRRVIREAQVNMFDAPGDTFRELFLSDEQIEIMAKAQNKMDLTDLRIFQALNKKRPMEEVYDFKVLHEISGLDPNEMLEGIKLIVENMHLLVPLFHMNAGKMGLTNHVFLLRIFQATPSFVKAMIADQLSSIPDFNMVCELTDSFYDIVACVYRETSNIDAIRNIINGIGEIEEIKEADCTREFRRWTCRLDEKAGMWEECVLTDDFLQDKTRTKMPKINLCRAETEVE